MICITQIIAYLLCTESISLGSQNLHYVFSFCNIQFSNTTCVPSHSTRNTMPSMVTASSMEAVLFQKQLKDITCHLCIDGKAKLLHE